MTRKTTADKVTLLDSNNEPHMIERRDDVSSLESMIKGFICYGLLVVIGGIFFIMVLIAFFGGE